MTVTKELYQIGDQEYLVIAGTVKGLNKLENQDCYQVYADAEQLIVVVADGLGSASRSQEGARKIVAVATEILANKVTDKNLAEQIFQAWQAVIPGDFAEYDTTIKFIKLTNNHLQFGGVGDGWIAIKQADQLVSQQFNHIFTNQTESILSENLSQKFLVDSISNDFDNLLIATDGYAEDLDQTKGVQFLADVYQSIQTNVVDFTNDLRETLQNWPVANNHDDKTVVFIQKIKEIQ